METPNSDQFPVVRLLVPLDTLASSGASTFEGCSTDSNDRIEHPNGAAPESLADIKARLDARDVAAELIGPGKRSGRSIRYSGAQIGVGGDNTTRFSVTARGFKDWRDGTGGDVVQLVALIQNVNRAEAADWLRARHGGAITAHPIIHQSEQTSASEPPPNDWQRCALTEAIEPAERYLWSNAPDARRALNYLRYARGLTDDTIRLYRLGYNPRWHKLTYRDPEGNKRIHLPPGITIPYVVEGAIWAVRVRSRVGNLAEALAIEDDTQRDGEPLAKYLNLRGSKVNGPLFNGDDLRIGVEVLIVEGEFDAVLAQQELGAGVTVVTMGPASSRLSGRWRDRLANGGQIYATLDDDAAGKLAADRLAKAFSAPLIRLKLPMGKDITEYVIEHNGDLCDWWAHRPTLRLKFDPEARCFRNGVPDSWRSTLLNFNGDAALVYELITESLRTGQIDPDSITLAELFSARLKLGWGISEDAIRRGFKVLKEYLFAKLHTESQESVCKSTNNSKRGRIAEVFRWASLGDQRRMILEMAAPGLYERAYPAQDTAGRPAVVADFTERSIAALGFSDDEAAQIVTELNELSQPAYVEQRDLRRKASKRARVLYARLADALDDPNHTPLPAGWLPYDAATYRVALLRAWMIADVERLRSRRQIADAVGIAPRSVDSYLERAGIEVEGDQFEQCPILDPYQVEREVTRLGYEVKGKPRTVIAHAIDGSEQVQPYSSIVACEFVPVQIAAGALVFVRFQVANRHRVDLNATPAMPTPRQPIEKPAKAEGGVQAVNEAWIPPEEVRPVAIGGYSVEWVRGQLALRLRIMGWMYNERFMNPNTGEIASSAPDAAELIALMLGREIEFRIDKTLLEAAASLGAVVKELA